MRMIVTHVENIFLNFHTKYSIVFVIKILSTSKSSEKHIMHI